MESQRKRRPIDTRFIVRSLIVGLAVITLALVGASFLPPEMLARLAYFWQINQPPPSTPPPPTLVVPQGALPSGPVGLLESALYMGGLMHVVGCGFLLQLEGGPVIGVTTAHSLGLLGSPSNLLERVAFSVAGQPDLLVTFDQLYGPPGLPRYNDDLVLDYVLLKLPDPAPAFDTQLVLTPDTRGAPQPGERVVLYSGLGNGQGAPRPLRGTVLSVDALGLWVVMEEAFDAGGMSGSPLISEHTGRLVGMAMAVMYRRGHTMVGFHPIGSIIQHAQAATAFPLITEFRR